MCCRKSCMFKWALLKYWRSEMIHFMLIINFQQKSCISVVKIKLLSITCTVATFIYKCTKLQSDHALVKLDMETSKASYQKTSHIHHRNNHVMVHVPAPRMFAMVGILEPLYVPIFSFRIVSPGVSSLYFSIPKERLFF
jgi:hypothetical protein